MYDYWTEILYKVQGMDYLLTALCAAEATITQTL